MMRRIRIFWAIAGILILGAIMGLKSQVLEKGRVNYWQGGTFSQPNIDTRRLKEGIVRAKVDGKWQDFSVRELPEGFIKWNLERRLEMNKNLKEGRPPSLAGPHFGMVASYGGKRKDSQFSINCAVKGIGLLPKEEKLDEIISLLKNTFNDSMERKLNILESLYKRGQEVFDFTKQTSLELYSTPEFETHTFLNVMANPAVAIVFLDFPSYELKAITQFLHPENKALTPYEKKVVSYLNLIHDYFHGEAPRKSIGVVYHIVEVFDNTPGRAKGKRVIPPR